MPADNEVPMEVDLAFLADAANVGAGGKLNVLGMFNQVFSDTFPYQHPQLYCVVRFTAKPSEFTKRKEVEITLLNPDGKVVGTLKGQAAVPKPDEGRRASVELILTMRNVPFEHPGDYAFAILVGGEEKWSIPLQVVQRKGGRGDA